MAANEGVPVRVLPPETVELAAVLEVRVISVDTVEVTEGELEALALGTALPVEEMEAVDDSVVVKVSTCEEPYVFVDLAVPYDDNDDFAVINAVDALEVEYVGSEELELEFFELSLVCCGVGVKVNVGSNVFDDITVLD